MQRLREHDKQLDTPTYCYNDYEQKANKKRYFRPNTRQTGTETWTRCPGESNRWRFEGDYGISVLGFAELWLCNLDGARIQTGSSIGEAFRIIFLYTLALAVLHGWPSLSTKVLWYVKYFNDIAMLEGQTSDP